MPARGARARREGRSRPRTPSSRSLCDLECANRARRPPRARVGLAGRRSGGRGRGRAPSARRAADAVQRRRADGGNRTSTAPATSRRLRLPLGARVHAGRVSPSRALADHCPPRTADGEGARGHAAGRGRRAPRLRPRGSVRRAGGLQLRPGGARGRLRPQGVRSQRPKSGARHDGWESLFRRGLIRRGGFPDSAGRPCRTRARRADEAVALAPARADAGGAGGGAGRGHRESRPRGGRRLACARHPAPSLRRLDRRTELCRTTDANACGPTSPLSARHPRRGRSSWRRSGRGPRCASGGGDRQVRRGRTLVGVRAAGARRVGLLAGARVSAAGDGCPRDGGAGTRSGSRADRMAPHAGRGRRCARRALDRFRRSAMGAPAVSRRARLRSRRERSRRGDRGFLSGAPPPRTRGESGDARTRADRDLRLRPRRSRCSPRRRTRSARRR